MRFIIKMLANGLAIWLTSMWLNGIHLQTDGSWQDTLLVVAVVAFIFTAVNAIVKPLVQIVSIVFYILTLGLFCLVLNALMLLLTSWVSSWFGIGLVVDGFLAAVLAALVISIISVIVTAILPSPKRATEVRR